MLHTGAMPPDFSWRFIPVKLKNYLLVKNFLASFTSVESSSNHLWERQHESTFVEEFVRLVKLVPLFHLLSWSWIKCQR